MARIRLVVGEGVAPDGALDLAAAMIDNAAASGEDLAVTVARHDSSDPSTSPRRESGRWAGDGHGQ